MMQSILIAAPVILWIMAAIYLTLVLLFLKQAQRDPKRPVPLLLAGITLGLCYDAVVLGLGAFLGDAKILKILSYPRYILHGAMIPLLIPICAHALDADKKVLKAVGILTAGLTLLGAWAGCRVQLKPFEFAGVTRYIADNDLTPKWVSGLLPVLSAVPTLILIVCGIILWKKKGRKELALSGLFMLFFAGIGPATGHLAENFLLSMFGEVGSMIFLWLYAKHD